MGSCKPLRAVVFSYDCLRLLFLAVFCAFFSASESFAGAQVFPDLVYLSPNALFPLMAFLIFIRPTENKNYLPLYLAGKAVAVVLFYVWAVFSIPFDINFLDMTGYIRGIVFLGGFFIISLGDALSVFGVFYLLKTKSKETEFQETQF